MFSGKRAGIGLVIFTLATTGAGGAGAASPPVLQRVPAPAQSGAAQVRVWLQRVVAWSSSYFDLMHEQGAVLHDVNDRVQATLRAQPVDPAEVKAWADAQRAKLAVIDEKAVAMQGRPFPAMPAYVAIEPKAQKMIAAYAKLPGVVSRQLREDSTLVRSVIDQIVLASGGGADARKLLTQQTLQLDIAMIEGENTVVEASNASLPENDPQWDLATCSEESNLAAVDLLRFALRGMTGEAGDDRVAVAKSIHIHALRVSALSGDMVRDANAKIAALPRASGADTKRLFGTERQVLELYLQSAANEGEISKGLDQVAVRLGDQAVPVKDAFDAFSALATLEQQRGVFVEQRRQLLTR